MSINPEERGNKMFDTNKVASNIKAARTKMNMTQMNLADEMGVSYQAVSNWERGNSMPDISRLQELCNILGITFEELVGEKSQQTEIVERLMKDEETEVNLEEIAQVAPFLSQETLKKIAGYMLSHGKEKHLLGIAPFIGKETISNIVYNLQKKD